MAGRAAAVGSVGLLCRSHRPELKRSKAVGNELPRLKGKHIAPIFEKPSTHTRYAFEVAVHDQGGHVTYLDGGSSPLGHKGR